MALTPGTTVRFAADHLGVLDNALRAPWFVADVFVNRGDTGTVRGPHPDLDQWLMIDVVVDGKQFVCPVHDEMVEAI